MRLFLPQLDYSLLPKRLQHISSVIFTQPLYIISRTLKTSSFHFAVDSLLGKIRHQRIKCCDYTSLENNQHPSPAPGLARQHFPEKREKTNLFQHLVLFVEEFHFDISAHWQRLREFKVHILVFTS